MRDGKTEMRKGRLDPTRVCLITSEHVTTDPRLVKEADAFHEAGLEVRVVACRWREWATHEDTKLLRTRSWRCHVLDWTRARRGGRFWYSRFRQRVVKSLLAPFSLRFGIAERSVARVVPELMRTAAREPADLFIAHNLPALPAAVNAARKYHARVGYDLEDFHPGIRHDEASPSVEDLAAEHLEQRYLPECDYLTAASSGIAAAYVRRYGIPNPVTILNVFPFSDRPANFRPTDENGPLTLYWFSQTIGENRGLEDAVRAIGALAGLKIELHLRGDWQPGYRDRLFQVASSAGVRSEQITASPPAPATEMVRLASDYDVGLALEQPISENRRICLTNKIFTYLLAGNAVLATNTTGQRSIVETIGEAGFLYSPGDIRALADRIRFWYQNRRLLDDARRRAWDWGTRRYNWECEKKIFLDLIDEVLANHGELVAHRDLEVKRTVAACELS